MDESDSERNLEQAILQVLDAYEQVLYKKHGRRILAQRTRKMFANYGMIGAVDRIVSRKKSSPGYASLTECGKHEFTFEAIVLRYPQFFSPKAVRRSTERVEGRTHQQQMSNQ